MSALYRSILLSLVCSVLIPLQAAAWDRGNVELFATLPDGVRFPEGITANPANGDVFVGSFDIGAPNWLLRFNGKGRLEASRDMGATPLLGLAFHRRGNNESIYIAAVGDFSGTGSRIQRIAANLQGRVEDVAQLPAIGAPAPRVAQNPDGSSDTITFGGGARVPNALTFDGAGNLYVSDSFQGAIFRIADAATCAPRCTASLVAHDPLLATAGFPPFGANGIAFNADESALFIANTGDDRVLKLDMKTKAVTVFAESINGADGLAFDKASGLLWVAANQADELVALNKQGGVVAKLGDFGGLRDGSHDGLLFPASIVIQGSEIFVTNLALPLTAGDQQEASVSRYTISRIRLPGR